MSEECRKNCCSGAAWEDDLLFGIKMASPSCWGGKTGGDLGKRWPDDPGPRSIGDGDLPVPGSCCGSRCHFLLVLVSKCSQSIAFERRPNG